MKKTLLLMLSMVFCLAMNAKVTLDFTNATAEWGIPTGTGSTTNTYDETTYSNGTYTISLGAPTTSGNGFYFNSGGYLMLCDMGAYIKLPVFDFAVGTIVVGGRSGASTSATMNIFVDDTAVSSEWTSSADDQTYVIDSNYQAVGTQYTYKNTSSKNVQVTSITIYAVGEEITDDEETTTPTGHGYEADDPYTVAELLPLVAALSSSGSLEGVYVSGIITYITELSISYGNATYYISDDGTRDTELLIYRGYSLNNAKFTNEDEIQDGDEVIVYGKFVNYQGNTPEGATGATYIYSLNGNTGSDSGSSSTEPAGEGHGYEADDPFTASEAIALAETLDASTTIAGVYVSGIISQINEISTSYGNATYFISDDGTTTNQFEIYRGYYLDGESFSSGDEIALTDKVVVYGDLVNFYGNTPELTTGSKIVSIEKGDGTTQGGDEQTEMGGLDTFENGSFEEWSSGYPVGWKSSTTASNATLSQSSDAQEGSYAVEIPLNTSTNQRLASKEFLLPAGTYTVAFYAKSSSAEGQAHIAAGYAPWNSDDNKMGSYVYSDYYDIPADAWTLLTWAFTLDAETQVNLVVMNQHSGTSAVLIDNYSITFEGSDDDDSGEQGDDEEGTETGITAVAPSVADSAITYNLAGQPVGDNYRGIVIRNGKKYLNR